MKQLICRFSRCRMKGFVSVEYSLLCSALFIVVSFLIYISLFQYNKCILSSNTYMLGMYGEELLMTGEEDIRSLLENKSAQLYNEKYIFTENVEKTIHTTGRKKELIGVASMKNPLYEIGIGTKYWQAQTVYVMSDRNPANILFLYKHIKKVFKENEE